MASSLSLGLLRNQLLNLLEIDSPLISWIKHPQALLRRLQDLDRLIEMEEIKVAIVRQIQFLIVSESVSRGLVTSVDPPKKRPAQILHTAIMGPPGVGKTKVGSLLAQILNALGFLEGSSENQKESLEESLRRELEQGFEILRSLWRQLNKFDSGFKLSRSRSTLLSQIRLQVEQLKEVFQRSASLLPAQQSLEMGDECLVIAGRADFVGEYQGHSAIKTRNFLRRHTGKVILIDEAYSLYTGERDNFGYEALTTLVQEMSERPSEFIIILAGYREEMHRSIFKAQPGLYRRITWFFELSGYSPEGLAQIFKYQLQSDGWGLDSKLDLVTFFARETESFTYYGGDTLKLTFYCKLVYSEHHFAKSVTIDGHKHLTLKPLEPMITESVLQAGYRMFRVNRGQKLG